MGIAGDFLPDRLPNFYFDLRLGRPYVAVLAPRRPEHLARASPTIPPNMPALSPLSRTAPARSTRRRRVAQSERQRMRVNDDRAGSQRERQSAAGQARKWQPTAERDIRRRGASSGARGALLQPLLHYSTSCRMFVS